MSNIITDDLPKDGDKDAWAKFLKDNHGLVQESNSK
jgi:hypothetical protein